MDKFLSDKIKVISFWAIVLVVFLHSYNLDTKQHGEVIYFQKSLNWVIQNFISNGVTRIAVPFFFLISGFLFFLKFDEMQPDFYSKIKKRFRTLFLPYLIWSLVGLLFYFILQCIPATHKFFNKELILNYDLCKLIETIFVNPIAYQLWFIRDLFVIVLLIPVFYFLLRYTKSILLLVVLLIWLYDVEVIKNSVEALFFFLTGSYICLYKKTVINYIGDQKTILLFILWIVLLLTKTYLSFIDNDLTLIKLLHKIAIITGIAAFWNGYNFLHNRYNFFKENKMKAYSVTFFIYAFHEPTLTFFKKGLFFVFGVEEKSYLTLFFLAPVLTLLVSYYVAIIFKKQFNSIYNITTGGR